MKRRRDRSWTRPTKPKASSSSTTNEEAQISPAAAKERMLLDWASGIKTATAYRQNMLITRAERMKEVRKSPGIMLLRHFPALQLTDLV